MYSSLMKGSTLFKSSGLISNRFLLKKFLRFSFSTKSQSFITKLSFKNTIKNIHNSHNFYTLGRRNFSSEGANETTLYLSEHEAYLLNEHDRMVVQLTNNVVGSPSLPKFMKELVEICYLLSKYKEYIKGWNYVTKFFSDNLKNFSNDELLFYVGIFSLTNIYAGKIEFWQPIGDEILNRSLNKESTLKLINYFSLCGYNNKDFWTAILRKANSFDLKEYKELIQLAGDLNTVTFVENDPIYENILSKLENQEIKILSDLPATYILRAANLLKERTNRNSVLYENVKDFFLKNFRSIQSEFIGIFCEEFVKLSPPNTTDLVNLITQAIPHLSNASKYAKYEFYHVIMRWCVKYPDLISALNTQKLANFNVPTQQMVSEFDKLQNDIILSDFSKGKSLANSFWVKHSQAIGLDSAFAELNTTHGGYQIHAMEEAKKGLKNSL
jgi:hypothetical protein